MLESGVWKKNTTVWRSRGGLTTKVHLVTDGTGKPVKFQLTAGQAADCNQVTSLLKGQKAEAVLGDKGYDADQIIEYIKDCMKAQVGVLCRKVRNFPDLPRNTRPLHLSNFSPLN